MGDAQNPPPASGRGKLTFKDQHDLDRLPATIDRIEREIAEAEEALSDANLYGRDPAAFAELTRVAAAKCVEKEAAEERWLEVAEMAETLGRG